MKMLHAGDLHLGRTFHERSLLEDQRNMLDQLAQAIQADDYAALLIAGDVYDRSIPPPEAVGLLGAFLSALRRAAPDLAVVMVPGNHDSPERLGYARELFSALGIHIIDDPSLADAPILIDHDGERCAVFGLPFLVPGSMRDEEGRPLRSQRDLCAAAAAKIELKRGEMLHSAEASLAVLVAHLFAAGGMESDSERAFIGTAERVDPRLFARFDYAAFGHLHRFQKAAANAWYAGSPLAYSFDEADQMKGFVSVGIGRDADAGSPAVKPIPVTPLRAVRRLSGRFEDFNAPSAFDGNRDDYLEIVLLDDELVENPLALLRPRYPFLLSIRQDRALSEIGGKPSGPRDRPFSEGRRDPADDFSDFLADVYGETDNEKVELFSVLAKEVEHAPA
jgi:exonuclease SbcD